MSGGTRVYIGKLPADVRRGDIEDLFRDYGRLRDVRLMGTFGFVEFEHPRDAEDAVKDYDGKNFMGERILVQHAKGARRDAGGDPYDRRGPPGGGYGSRDGGSDYGSRYGGPPPQRREPRIRRGQFRCLVSNLPANTSWQDLKDIGREHGSISFADVDASRPDQGTIEYDNKEDYERALDKIEGIELRGNKLRIDPADSIREDRERSPPRRRDDSPRRRNDSPPPRRRDDSPPPRRREDSREPREELRAAPSVTRDAGGWGSESPPPAGNGADAARLDD